MSYNDGKDWKTALWSGTIHKQEKIVYYLEKLGCQTPVTLELGSIGRNCQILYGAMERLLFCKGIDWGEYEINNNCMAIFQKSKGILA